jgi:hypothetical protein
MGGARSSIERRNDMSNLSPAPGTPQTPAKAIVAAVVSLLTIGLGAVLVALQSNPPGAENAITGDEWIVIALAVLGAPILTGGATYATTNKATAR